MPCRLAGAYYLMYDGLTSGWRNVNVQQARLLADALNAALHIEADRTASYPKCDGGWTSKSMLNDMLMLACIIRLSHRTQLVYMYMPRTCLSD
eukprot:1160099-Pelagomonas_calceolata.AAC.7